MYGQVLSVFKCFNVSSVRFKVYIVGAWVGILKK
jgi:hypothetical protein